MTDQFGASTINSHKYLHVSTERCHFGSVTPSNNDSMHSLNTEYHLNDEGR